MTPISILLVEDEAPKCAHIMRFFDSLRIPTQVTIARSVTSALEALDQAPPDLLLLDMSLPTFDIGDREGGGRPQGFGGTEILRYMTMAGISSPAIVVTGYEAFARDGGGPVDLSQLRTELQAEFPELMRGVLHFNSTFDEWKVELAATLRELGLWGDET